MSMSENKAPDRPERTMEKGRRCEASRGARDRILGKVLWWQKKQSLRLVEFRPCIHDLGKSVSEKIQARIVWCLADLLSA